MSQRINKANLRKLISLFKRYAPLDLYYKIREKLSAPYQEYSKTYPSYLPTAEERKLQRERHFSYEPLMSIVVPAYETEEAFLRQMIDSVLAQTYAKWELCIADGSKSGRVQEAISRNYPDESRIRYKKLEKNAGISENTNRGFAMAKGDYIGLLDHDDLLAPSALYEMVAGINATGADMLYSDEDKIFSDVSCHTDPHFKLDFNRELLLGNNYICHFLVVKRELLCKVGGLDGAYDGAQDFDFVLRLSEQAERIEHIPKILYHWRMHAGSTAVNTDSKPYAYEAGKRAVESCLSRNGLTGTVHMSQDLGFYRTAYEAPENISVGICCWKKVAPEKGSKNQKEHAAAGSLGCGLQLCPVSERQKSMLARELSGLRVELFWDCQPIRTEKAVGLPERNERKTTAGQGCKPDYILFINEALRNFHTGSIAELLGSCARPGIALAGSKTTAKGKVLQCGFWKREGTWIPRFQGLHHRFKGYFRRAYLPVEVDAVSPDLAILKTTALPDKRFLDSIVPESRNQKSTAFAYLWWNLCDALITNGYKIIIDPAAEAIMNDRQEHTKG